METSHHTGGGVKGHPIMAGGLGAEKPADPEVQAVCESVKAAFLKESAVNATEFKAVKYKSQVVAGTNYFVKVWLGGDQYCHLSIFKPLPYTGEKAKLSSFQMGKTKADAIVHF